MDDTDLDSETETCFNYPPKTVYRKWAWLHISWICVEEVSVLTAMNDETGFFSADV